MTNDEKIEQIKEMLGEDYSASLLNVYLRQAKQLILNKRFPYGDQPNEVEAKYEQLQIELAISLFNERGAEGQSTHNENGVSRHWRTKEEIMFDVVPCASVL